MATLAVLTNQTGSRAAPHGSLRRLVPTVLVAAMLVPLLAGVITSLAASGAAYGQWWASARGWSILVQTFQLGALAATIAVALAWLTACALVRLPLRARIVLALVCGLPLLLPSSLLATAWIVALGREGALTGLFRTVLGFWTWTIFDLPVAAAGIALRYFGLAVIILLFECQRQQMTWPAERLMAPALAWRWWHLRIRPAAAPLVVAWSLVFILAINDHIMPGMFLISTYGTQVLIQYSALLDPAGAAALAAPFAVLGLLPAWLVMRRRRGPAAQVGERLNLPAGASITNHAAQIAAVIAVLFVLAASMAVPFVVLVSRTESVGDVVAALVDAKDQVWQTLQHAAVGGTLAVLVAIPLAADWVRSTRVGGASVVPILIVNLAAPATLLGLGVVALTSHWPMTLWRDTSWPLTLTYAARFVPVAMLLLYAWWLHEDASPDRAARVYRVAPWRRWWHLVWPRRRTSILAAFVLSGLLIATELEVANLLAPPGGSTLGVRLYTLIHTAPDEAVSALALGTIGLIAPLLILLVGLIVPRAVGGERSTTR